MDPSPEPFRFILKRARGSAIFLSVSVSVYDFPRIFNMLQDVLPDITTLHLRPEYSITSLSKLYSSICGIYMPSLTELHILVPSFWDTSIACVFLVWFLDSVNCSKWADRLSLSIVCKMDGIIPVIRQGKVFSKAKHVTLRISTCLLFFPFTTKNSLR
jgi:hypothetical protein